MSAAVLAAIESLRSELAASRAVAAGVDPEFGETEVARMLGVSTKTVKRLRYAGKLGFYPRPGVVRIGAKHVKAYQESTEGAARMRAKARKESQLAIA